ncbi:ectonucleoside triphosphate diphosphohydrolase 3 isoform X2 [Balaenoptera acutorostrata]|uniref:Ectonucleoside triphosphate diphosphohydrolase 3 isoform X2 n=1 Tax=Balaenoptera acutorostrata TaxID=9767 RepID=A0A452C3F5_BALAC|nr:ectonucleoside triphosphate diphosphohydrolase 3 isoform X2 [Balaenoptera acutorostrata]
MFTVLTRQPCEQAGLKALSRISAIITLVFLLLSIVVLVAVTLIQIHQKEVLLPGLKYGIVLDAGSSRTTVYVYQWPGEKENNTGVVSQTFKCSVKGSGISSYGENPQDAPKAFEDCMQKVKGHIPAHLHGSTCIYLGATAGMRLLRLQNETAANEVLASIQNYFESQPFDFRDAQIISGQEEGIYGWITANYLMGNFLEKSLWHMWVHPNGKETTGALDLGGASTQISFAVEEKNVGLNTSDIVKVSLYGYEYTLYTHSFQCYGRNEAEKRFLAILLQAFAGFYYTASAFNLSGSFSLHTFNSSTWNFCSQNWGKLPLLLPRFDEEYARSYCFSAHYIYHLLVNGYKFTEETWPQIHFKKEVGNSSIAWSLGYMLSLTNQIPAESPLIRLPIKPSAFMGTLAFFAAVALLCLTYLVYLCVSSRNQRRSQHALDNTVDSE